jgi:two-component system phosphate regulon sensor histidine kinase PhoR
VLIILILIVLLPALFFSAYEISTLDDYEQLITEVYGQQLETILFSINQYSWNYVNAWMDRLQQIFMSEDDEEIGSGLQQLLENNSSIKYIQISDTLLLTGDIYWFDQDTSTVLRVYNDTLLTSRKVEVERLLKISDQGYRKVESVPGTENGTEIMTLFYIQPMKDNKKLVIAIIIDQKSFISEIMTPKFEEISGGQFSVAVANQNTNQIIYSNSNVDFESMQQKKKLWLFPEYVLGIQLIGKSIEDLAQTRFYNSLILIGALLVFLLIGLFFLIRIIRREILLAKMKSDFVSNVSHELRTPLALIRMYAETLEMGRMKTDAKRDSYYRIINQESERLTRLINNILNFSRIESGRKEYHLTNIDVNAVINKVLDMYLFHLEKEGFTVQTDLEENLPDIQADSEAITEALLNLVDNAVSERSLINFTAFPAGWCMIQREVVLDSHW